jgi:hypothetical protein
MWFERKFRLADRQAAIACNSLVAQPRGCVVIPPQATSRKENKSSSRGAKHLTQTLNARKIEVVAQSVARPDFQPRQEAL